MIERPAPETAFAFLDLVKSKCCSPLVTELLTLHQPVLTGQRPGCAGCDQTHESTHDPVWPCRTFTIIAATLLYKVKPDREFQLLGYLADAERQNTRNATPRFDAGGYQRPAEQLALHV